MWTVSPRARKIVIALGPFAGATTLAWVAMPIGSAIEWRQYAAATSLMLVAFGLWTLDVGSSRRRGLVPGALVYLAATGLLRNAAGGMVSGAGALAIVAVFQTALSSQRRRDLAAVLAALAAFYLVPTIFVGGAAYPSTQYRTTVLVVAISSIIGWATQHLVGQVRDQVRESHARERRLERVTAVVHSLLDSPDARGDVCEAARSIGDATVALIYEPGRDGALSCTAMTGLQADGRRIVAAAGSAVDEAYRTGRSVLIDTDAEHRVGSRKLWEGAGRPQTVLYEPLRRSGEVLGVLVVAWSDRVAAQASRTAIVSLLAHEAASVIARADVVASLVGEARTDALTGLANRRAWDDAVVAAIAGGGPVTVAILDLDHFKQFNDTHGHPAGDRLLKATAAAWRDQLRSGDLLARIGGEEFGLLLAGDQPAEALGAVERLRGAISMGRTCSAGIAIREPDESGAELLVRADAALYAAKTAGRDRATVGRAGDAAPDTERRFSRSLVPSPPTR